MDTNERLINEIRIRQESFEAKVDMYLQKNDENINNLRAEQAQWRQRHEAEQAQWRQSHEAEQAQWRQSHEAEKTEWRQRYEAEQAQWRQRHDEEMREYREDMRQLKIKSDERFARIEEKFDSLKKHIDNLIGSFAIGLVAVLIALFALFYSVISNNFVSKADYQHDQQMQSIKTTTTNLSPP